MVKRFILIISLLVGVAACDLLDTNPTDFYTTDTFWKTPQHALDALTGCYQVLTTNAFFGSGGTGHKWEVMTPNAYMYNDELSTNTFAMGHASGTTLGMNDRIWSGSYSGIGRCNTVIDRINEIQMDEELRARIIGEARFLRAFYYNELNQMFHGVPLILSSPDPETQSDMPRNTYEEVQQQIIEDLDYAASVLPDSYPPSDGGRATKGAALALKARVLLQDHQYDQVVSVIEQIFALNQYELFPDYNGIFRKANEGNSEIIFDVRFKAPDVINDYDIVMAQYSTQAPLLDLVNAYQMIDGKSIQESDLYDPANPYENRDPRFKQSILYLGAPWRNRTANNIDLHQTGFSFRKFTEYNETTVGTIPQSDVNYIVIRYADVLLMYAEALNELSGPTQEVYDAVNQVRTRPTVDMPPLPAGLSQEEMREAIRLERRIELAGERSYYFDIRRWGIAEEVMTGPVHDYTGRVLAVRQFNPDKDYLWPIPYTEIELNPNLTQNPGY